jgi:hypothetical protein
MQVEPIEGGETRYRESWTPNLEGQSCLAGGQKTSNLEHFRYQSPYPSALFTSVVYRTGQDSKPKLPTSGSPTIQELSQRIVEKTKRTHVRSQVPVLECS